MDFAHIMFAVAARIDLDQAFVVEPAIQGLVIAALQRDRQLDALAVDPQRTEYLNSPKLDQCIERAAVSVMRDLNRVSEICDAAIARYCLKQNEGQDQELEQDPD